MSLLSERLKTVAAMITPGSVVADVGCDHAYLSIYMVKEGLAPYAIASDVASGPLQHARENVLLHHLEGKISIRMGSGLSTLKPAEADTLVIAGMGGMLMVRLLQKEPSVAESFSEMVLSPQSDIYEVRKYLSEHGWRISKEAFLVDEGKPYQVLKVIRAQKPCILPQWALAYGETILPECAEGYKAWLTGEIEKRVQILSQFDSMTASERLSARRNELTEEIGLAEERLKNMKTNITVTIAPDQYNTEGGPVTVPKGTTYLKIVETIQQKYPERIVLVHASGKLRELSRKASDGDIIIPVTEATSDGIKTVRRSTLLVMLKAVHDVVSLGKSGHKLKVDFSLSKGLYSYFTDGYKLSGEELDRVYRRMKELCEADLPIEKTSYPTDEAIRRFAAYGMTDKVRLFGYRRSSTVNCYRLQGYEDYFYGYMVPSTSYIKVFQLYPYEDGFVLQLPVKESPSSLPEFAPQHKIYRAMQQTEIWSDKLGIRNVGELNDLVTGNESSLCSDVNELILIQEALMEKKLGDIAEKIAEDKRRRIVMIAGPSSSGKTTFSHRLSIQLKALGLRPHPIGVDNYFINREDNPKDEHGNYNFENLESIDIKLFNEHLEALLSGKEVELPEYNFITGEKEFNGDFLKLEENDILVIEGIHCLNKALYPNLPDENIFRIYISALTQLNIDEHNRIPTTDGRLLRRIVRDARTRGYSADKTIAMWENVRKGEDKNIFPYQESADVVFNSALIYELAVIKTSVEPLLFAIRRDNPAYVEARRLLKFLEYFVGISPDIIPMNSILREFVGGSCFKV